MNLFILYHFQWHCILVNNQTILLFPHMVYREKLTSHHIHYYETFNKREHYDPCTSDISYSERRSAPLPAPTMRMSDDACISQIALSNTSNGLQNCRSSVDTP